VGELVRPAGRWDSPLCRHCRLLWIQALDLAASPPADPPRAARTSCL